MNTDWGMNSRGGAEDAEKGIYIEDLGDIGGRRRLIIIWRFRLALVAINHEFPLKNDQAEIRPNRS